MAVYDRVVIKFCHCSLHRNTPMWSIIAELLAFSVRPWQPLFPLRVDHLLNDPIKIEFTKLKLCDWLCHLGSKVGHLKSAMGLPEVRCSATVKWRCPTGRIAFFQATLRILDFTVAQECNIILMNLLRTNLISNFMVELMIS